MASVFLSAICGRKKYRMAHSPHSTLNTSRYRPPTASERVPICRADGAICVIGKHPAGICVPQCDLWAYKTPAWPHSTFRIQHSTFHIPHSTFHIPHYKLFLSARVRAAVTVRHLLRWLLSRQPPPSVVFAVPKGAHPRSPNCRRAKVFPLLISLFCNGNIKY